MSEAVNFNDQQDSIEISKNSKGYNWSVKRYYDFDKVSPEDIISQIEKIDQALQEKFKGEQ